MSEVAQLLAEVEIYLQVLEGGLKRSKLEKDLFRYVWGFGGEVDAETGRKPVLAAAYTDLT